MTFDFLAPVKTTNPTIHTAANLAELSVEQLIETVESANSSYRSGNPVVSDEIFDTVYMAELAKRVPDHDFFHKVQPEPVLASKGRIIHATPMLSTQKAYLPEELQKWINKMIAAGERLGVKANDIVIRCTTKYDGIAAKYLSDTKQLVSRGDGLAGTLLKELLDAGIIIKGDTSKDVVGEIMVSTKYFEEHLSNDFAHPRNFIAGIAGKSINKFGKKALKDGAIELLGFDAVDSLTTTADVFMGNFESMEEAKLNSDYALDGVIFEVINDDIRDLVGCTDHHPIYSIAKKRIGEEKETSVENIRWQIGHSGKCSPVLEITPTILSSSNVTSITAHNAQALVNNGWGVGSKIRAIKSGEIIPKVTATLSPVAPVLPTHCPECEELLAKESVFLVCNNTECKGVLAASLYFSLKRLGLLNFGRVACAKLVEAHVNTVKDVLEMSASQFVSCGFGDGQAKVFLKEIARVQVEPISDSDIVSALGITGLGRGSAKKLLAFCDIENIANMTFADIVEISGFAEKTANSISYELADNYELLEFLVGFFGDGITRTPTAAEEAELAKNNDGSLAGENICFTGKMMRGTRGDIENLARKHGSGISSSITKRLTLLVMGDKVGATKMAKAEKLGVTMITEREFYSRIGL